MKTLSWAVVLCAVLVVSGLAVSGLSQPTAQPLPDGAALADFDRRVKAYAALRDELEKGAAKLDETAKPEDLVRAELALAARIRQARPTATRGDIFTPEIQARFRQLLNPEMRGVRGQNTRGIIRDEGPGPGAFSFTVNDIYPKQQPLGSVPANILQTLPPLPEHLEYRFVDTYLILRDTRANLIVDYMPKALP
jgi:hypothetical protein